MHFQLFSNVSILGAFQRRTEYNVLDNCSVRLNSEAVSAELGLSVAAVVATMATESEIETENAETAVI